MMRRSLSSALPIAALLVALAIAAGPQAQAAQNSGTASRAYAARNAAPTIGGQPETRVRAGTRYAFTPVARDPEGRRLRFSITGRPAWASFDTTTGTLRGTATAGNYRGIVIRVSDGNRSAALPAFSIRVDAAQAPDRPVNAAPTITGSPPTTVTAGTSYSFTPTARDPEGQVLAFSVSNKPAWATFSTATGRLNGTPGNTQTGNYSNIVISVSDGNRSVALPAFAITVNATPSPATGSATLSWTPPTQNTDGSRLTNLAGFRVYRGTSRSTMTLVYDITDPSATSLRLDHLATGTHYFAVAAYNRAGTESDLSTVGSKTISSP